MTKLAAIIIGTLISFSTLGQEQNDFKIKVRDGNIDEHIFYLLTDDGNIQLDSIELRTIDPNWIKAINIVQLADDSVKDHTTSNFPSTANVYLELKRRYLKKFLNGRRKMTISNIVYGRMCALPLGYFVSTGRFTILVLIASGAHTAPYTDVMLHNTANVQNQNNHRYVVF